MILSIIVAMAHQRIIGLQGQMPWHLPADLAWFKKNTLNKPIIMGRKTYESIGRPLPNRHNIIISRRVADNDNHQQIQNTTSTHVTWVNSIDVALDIVQHQPEVFIIGGGNIYQQLLPYVDRLYLTHIDAIVQGDTCFPDYLSEKWHSVYQENHQADDKNPYDYQFEILQRCEKAI